jgi:hypothetical protein
MKLHFVLLCVAVLASRATPQSMSTIGKFLPYYFNSTPTMTIDGQWIAFVDQDWTCLSHSSVAIGMIRPDGTDFHYLLDYADTEALEDHETRIHDLRMSGDGRWLWFWWPSQEYQCFVYPPSIDFIVDVQTGVAKKFMYGGAPAQQAFFSDDGSRMSFHATDPVTGKFALFVGTPPDALDAIKVVEFGGVYLGVQYVGGAFGKISGDGKKFVWAGAKNPTFPYKNDFFVTDLQTMSITKLNSTPLTSAHGVDASYDASRVVFGDYEDGGEGPLYGVHGDGTGFHLITAKAWSGSATITRDGKDVFYSKKGNPSGSNVQFNYRQSWDGTGPILQIDGAVDYYANHKRRPIDANGSKMVCVTLPVSSGAIWPLSIWHADPPMLTTYGYGWPGYSLTCDVGGAPGDLAIVATSLGTGNTPTPYGEFLLDPFSTWRFTIGVVSGPNNVASKSFIIPPDLQLPLPVDVHFQALAAKADGSGATLTNRTTFKIKPYPSFETLTAPPQREAVPPARRQPPTRDELDRLMRIQFGLPWEPGPIPR